ncbi:cilia and flagella associated protein HOATZ [Lamellibrachia satsuma]|nr:cilia and flagella associated protein HOATZ [Lamellibrachia satsuma]
MFATLCEPLRIIVRNAVRLFYDCFKLRAVNMSALQKAISNNADTIVFSGSSPEDSAYAKTFWQSVQLLPPMESRLVSSHISQRLKTAPAFGAPDVNRAHPSTKEESFEVTNYLARVKELERADECKKLMKYSTFREADMALLQKHKETRIEREKVSAGHSPRQRQQIFLSEDTTQIPSDNLEEMKEKVKELDNFKEDLNDSD